MSIFGDSITVKRELRELRRQQVADQQARLAHRLALKQQIAKHLPSLTERRDGTLPEAIIRDFDRLDYYPKPDEGFRGISPWFKVEMRDQYHNGLEVLLKFENVVIEGHEARAVNDLEGSETVAVCGHIPYDSIVQIDWVGDEYYGQPHIYCSFDYDGEPYEATVVYRRDRGYWEALDGVEFKDRHTRWWQLRSLWRDWRIHQQMLREQKRWERESVPLPTSAIRPGD